MHTNFTSDEKYIDIDIVRGKNEPRRPYKQKEVAGASKNFPVFIIRLTSPFLSMSPQAQRMY